MRIEDIVHLHIPHDKKISKVKAASFHPTQQKIAVAFRSEVHGSFSPKWAHFPPVLCAVSLIFLNVAIY